MSDHGQILRTRFEAAYRKLYGHIIEGIDIEVLSWTLTIASPPPKALQPTIIEESDSPRNMASQTMFDPSLAEPVTVPVYHRDQLKSGAIIDGPALISESQTTTVVSAAFNVAMDERGNLILTRKDANG